MNPSSVDGLYVGLLTDDELLQFERLVAEGKAVRSYSGAGGLMGLAKVKILTPDSAALAAREAQS